MVEGKQEFKYSLLLFEWCTKWPEQRWSWQWRLGFVIVREEEFLKYTVVTEERETEL
jgi:hypothetical protein